MAITNFLKLIRLPNLLIMAFTQYMVRFCIVKPLLAFRMQDTGVQDMHLQLSEFHFFLLSLSTVMIAAAGYIINDYFDVRIDHVNRPNSNTIGKGIKRRVAMGAHMTINIIACLIGIWLAWHYGILRLGVILYVTVPALLWVYSTSLKRQFLVGNMLIALLSGLVPFIVVMFEIPALRIKLGDTLLLYENASLPNLFSDIIILTGILSAFAFVVSLIREIIKDTEDYEGDLEYGCRTLPIVLGISRAKGVIAGIILAVMTALGYLMYLAWMAKEWYSFMYFLIFLQVPFAYLALKVFRARDKKDFRFTSLVTKIIMVAGICYLFLFSFLLHQIA